MAVASRSKVMPVRPDRAAASAPSRRQQTARPLPKREQPLDRIDPRSQQFPHWLILLMACRKLSTPLLVLLVMGVLPLYAWRVNTQQSWGNQYTKLEQLQRDQRTWITRYEERKYQISENLEQNPAGFIPKSSNTTVFFEPAPARPAQPALPQQTDITSLDATPIGY